MAGVLGLLISTIGLDPIGGFPRFSFGLTDLTGGINFIPIMIGLFAASEAFKSMEDIFSSNQAKIVVEKTKLKWSEMLKPYLLIAPIYLSAHKPAC